MLSLETTTDDCQKMKLRLILYGPGDNKGGKKELTKGVTMNRVFHHHPETLPESRGVGYLNTLLHCISQDTDFKVHLFRIGSGVDFGHYPTGTFDVAPPNKDTSYTIRK